MPKVLVVDDSLSVRKVVQRALEAKRIEVLSAASGTEAMEQIARETPDLVVCDVIMPDMDGYQICDFVKKHPALGKTPVILISGIVNSTVLERAAKVGSDDVMRKPFAADELLHRIEGFLSVQARPAASAPAAAPVAAAPVLEPTVDVPTPAPLSAAPAGGPAPPGGPTAGGAGARPAWCGDAVARPPPAAAGGGRPSRRDPDRADRPRRRVDGGSGESPARSDARRRACRVARRVDRTGGG